MDKDKKPRPARRRARTSKGHYKADDPATPVNEAWESVPVEEALPKKDSKPKITGISNNTAGKYGKSDKVSKPTFGKVTSTFH